MLLPALFGVIVGTTLGLFGGGGSTVAIPLLAYGIGLSSREAIATALVAVGLAALGGALRHWKHGTLDLRVALMFGVVGAIGGAIGAQAARLLAPPVQMILFASVVLVAAGVMVRQPGASSPERTRRTPIAMALAALGPGLLTGLVGIGAGFAVVPALVAVAGMPIRRAIGTSLLVIALNAGGGILSYAFYVPMDAAVLVPFTASAVVAVLLATVLANRIDERNLRMAFAVMLVLVGTVTIVWEMLDLLGW